MDLKYYQYIIIAKRDGMCEETGKPIHEGDKIMYVPGTRGLHTAYVYSKDSKFYKKWENDFRTSNPF